MIKNCRLVSRIIAVILVLAVIGGGFLFRFRTLDDRSNQNVSIVMDYYDILMIKSSRDTSELINSLMLNGLSAVMLNDNAAEFADVVREGGANVGLSPIYMTNVETYLREYEAAGCNFPLIMSYSLPEGGCEALADAGMTVSIGFDSELPENFEPEKIDSLLTVTAGDRFTLADGEYDFTEAAQAIARSVDNDGVRAVVIPPLFDDETGIITDPDCYCTYIRQTVVALNALGYDAGSRFYSAYESSGIAVLPAIALSWGVCAAALIFANRLKLLKQKYNLAILGSALVISALLGILLPDLGGNLFAIIARIVLPCLAFDIVLRRSASLSRSNGNYGMGYAVAYCSLSAGAAGLLITAGELAANLLTLGAKAFSGLEYFRLTFAVYVIVTAFVICEVFMALYKTEGADIGEHIAGLFYRLRAHAARSIAIILVILLLIILYVLTLRSRFIEIGTALGGIWFSAVGTVPRALLYFVSLPCMALGMLLCARRLKGGAWPLLVFSVTSVYSLNSLFSTALEPITRHFTGALLSILLGVIFSALYCAAATGIIKALKFRHKQLFWWEKAK